MEDLHRLLADARGDLPPSALDLDVIAARGRKIIKRRRWSVVAAAVAVTLAAGSLIPFVRRDQHPSPPSVPASPAPAFAARLRAYDLGDFHVGEASMVTPGYEVAPVSRDHVKGKTHVVGSVEIYRPGAFDPHVFQAGTPITVAGRSGFLHVDTTTIRYGSSGNPTLATLEKPAVAWPYADDAWAVVRSSSDSPLTTGTLEQLASRLTLGAPAPVRLPFRLGYVPPGLKMIAAGRYDLLLANDPPPGRLGAATLAPDRSFTGLTGPVTLSGITIVEERQQPGVPRGGTTCDGSGCYRGLPGTDLYVGVNGRFPAAQLRKVLDGVTTADPSRPETWFPAQN